MPTTFVGRRAELARLDELLDAVGEGRSRTALITGDPGIGKSRLLDELARRAAARGCAVLAGSPGEFAREVPFGVFMQALTPALSPSILAELGAGERRLLAAVLPSLAGTAQPPRSAGDIDRYLLYRTIRALLDSFAARAGLVLVLDDLHWADPGSIDLLDYLVRQPSEHPVLFAVALRHRQAPARLWDVLAHAADGAPTSLDLPPLTSSEMDELLEPELSRPVRQHLHEASAGNPFYLDTLARAAAVQHLPPGTPVDLSLGDPALRPVLGALSAELAALSSHDLRVAQAAAVAGDPFDPEMISEVAPMTVSRALVGLDALTTRDVVRPEAARGFRFRHPLVRNAVYHTAGRAWLRDAHTRAATYLQRRGAPAAVRAPHLERSADAGDEEAVAVLVEAAESAMLTVPAVAAHWFEVAANLLPGTDRRRYELTLRRARAVGATGQFADSRDLLRKLLSFVEGEPSLDAEATTLCASMERLLGNHDESLALLTAALERMPDGDSGAADALRLELAIGCAHGGQLLAAMEWIAQVLASAARQDRPGVEVAGATGLLALGNAYAGDYDQAREYIEQSMGILDGVPDGELARHLTVVEGAWAETVLHRFRDAQRHFARGVAIARRTGQYHVLAPLLFGLCTAETWLGLLDAAREHAEAGVELARALSERSQYSAVLGGLAEIAYQQGAFDDAERCAQEAIRVRPQETVLWTGHAEGVLARIQLANGDPQGCIDQLLRAGDGPDLTAYQPGMRAPWYDVLAQAELARGRLDAASAWADRSAALAPVFGAEMTHTITRARIDVAAGRANEAADGARRAARYYHRTEMRVIEGDARHVLAAALTLAGDRQHAQEELRRAKELFAVSGARRMHARVVADQRRIGAGKPRGRKDGGVEPLLTEREQEVAELVAAGYSNRQIAAQLGVSPKTVQTHLSRVFAKLEVTSRAGLSSRLGTAHTGP